MEETPRTRSVEQETDETPRGQEILKAIYRHLSLTVARTNSINEMGSTFEGARRVQSCVLARFKEAGAYYVVRRRCASLMSWLMDNKSEIDGIACWFLTDDAVQDYNHVKSMLRDKTSQLSPFVVSFGSNRITIDKERKEEFEEAARDVFRNMGVIEADENWLNELLKLRINPKGPFEMESDPEET